MSEACGKHILRVRAHRDDVHEHRRCISAMMTLHLTRENEVENSRIEIKRRQVSCIHVKNQDREKAKRKSYHLNNAIEVD